MSVTHKNIFFDKKMPEVNFDAPESTTLGDNC